MAGRDANAPGSASFRRTQHLSSFLSLATPLRDNLLDQAEPQFSNFISNVRDHDVGLQTMATRFVGRGNTFAVRRTIDPSHPPVVFKSTLRGKPSPSDASESVRLNAILLELRVLTHPPIQQHRNIVKLLQVGWEGDAYDIFLKWPCLVLEYADYGRLTDWFDANPDDPQWDSLSLDIARGLQILHDCGVFHGDLKMDNVLVFSDEQSGTVVAKLCDFGGVILDGEAETTAAGTPPWTAPEWKQMRERSRHKSSDVYTLALLIWRIALRGGNPFQDIELFSLSEKHHEMIMQLDAEKLLDLEFLGKARSSVSKHCTEAHADLLTRIFDNSLRTRELDRSLPAVIALLEQEDESISDTTSSLEHTNVTPLQDIPVPFSLDGLEFTPMTMTLQPKILESLFYALSGGSHQRKIEAAVAIAMTNLAGDDFGLVSNPERGLMYLTLAAMLGSAEHRALVYRMHKAFSKPVPEQVASQYVGWLMEGVSRGSVGAAEDLKELGLVNELELARKELRSRYCGIGVDMFLVDDATHEALLSSDQTKVRMFLLKEMEEGKAINQDFREYFLKVASAYGNIIAVETILEELSGDVNGKNEIGSTPLLHAAWSGHTQVLLRLLELGADPALANVYGETPLHWLCAFEDSDIAAVGKALVDARAPLDAVAEEFVLGDTYVEFEAVAGTPLHRAVARNNIVAVRTLLELGADPFVQGDPDGDTTAFELAVLLHYPHIVRVFLDKIDNVSRCTDSSVIAAALRGGALGTMTFRQLVRHGHQLATRAEETLQIFLDMGAGNLMSHLPGTLDCSAVFYASRCHASVLRFVLRNGGVADIDRPATFADSILDEEQEDNRRPPLFEAIVWGKIENVQILLDHGADARVRRNRQNPITVLSQCAEAGFQDMALLNRFIDTVGVDDAPPDVQTPFALALLNRTFVIAEFLRDNGANVNALFKRYITGRSIKPITVLSPLAEENSPGSLACMEFLFRMQPNWSRVSFIVEPATDKSILHVLASLPGDMQDSASTLGALDLCWTYFDPQPAEINLVTRYLGPDETTSSQGARMRNAIDLGGNTMLHLAAISANLEVVRAMLENYGDIDTTIRNGLDLTALELALVIAESWENSWRPTDIPLHASKQRELARKRRAEIVRLLQAHTPVAARQDVLERFELAPFEEYRPGELSRVDGL